MKTFGKGTGYFKIPLLKPPHPKKKWAGGNHFIWWLTSLACKWEFIQEQRHLVFGVQALLGATARPPTPAAPLLCWVGCVLPRVSSLCPSSVAAQWTPALPPQTSGCPWGSTHLGTQSCVCGRDEEGMVKVILFQSCAFLTSWSTCTSSLCFSCPVTVPWALILVHPCDLCRCDIWSL